MVDYYLLKGEDKETLVLSSDLFERSGELGNYFDENAELNNCKPIDIVRRYYSLIGVINGINPFDFTSSNGSCRLYRRPVTVKELRKRRGVIVKKLSTLCVDVTSSADREPIVATLYDNIVLNGTIYALDFELLDTYNTRNAKKKVLFLQTSYDPDVPTNSKDSALLEVDLGLHSIMLFGRDPFPLSWAVRPEPVGSLDCVVGDFPRTLKMVGEDFLEGIMKKDEITF